ncbi:nicotinate-nucleotide adenylyltransferase [Hyunsoonleella flava]|uniref:Nicotinate-nucleotide adenylyltransferase n=1 Tax=Hyunsoonleella flava TaxID=2527939 RepID=A0A4Q9FDQ6_9FLAO|nr:nicotinate-nucleotide adenylyltransferase [Hyunsoonleella flava]TBN04312.1 nicotinate-nucleotide adenylyltransferase [Hyunsoonleella flava]
MKKLVIGLFLIGLTTQIYAQDPILQPAVIIVHNYKYLSSTGSEDLAIPVEQLQIMVSDFNVETLDIYSDEYDLYDVYFIIPKGKVLASYDRDGNLLRTAERYINIDLPLQVKKAVSKRFPNWDISKHLYVVNYHESKNIKKLYKLTLENGDKRIKVKVDDTGVFL